MKSVIDLTRVSRAQLDVWLHALELEARAKLGDDIEVRHTRTSDSHLEVEFVVPPVVLPPQPLDPNTFDRALTKAVVDINVELRSTKMANVTGASILGDQFRSNLAAIKDKVGKATQKMGNALKDLDDTASQANQLADQVTAETADLKAAMGLHSNGGPE